jgi:hypothetical protein
MYWYRLQIKIILPAALGHGVYQKQKNNVSE